LWSVTDWEEFDDKGRMTGQFKGEVFVIAWHAVKYKLPDWPSFRLGGSNLSISPELLERLAGRTLDMKEYDISLDPYSPELRKFWVLA